jgi:uncharacterized membrane protein
VIKGNSDNIRLTDSIKSCTHLSGICNEKFIESQIMPSHSIDWAGVKTLKLVFFINVDKSVFTPAQSIEWLGIIWDSMNFSLQIPDRWVQDLIESVSLILSELPLITARNLAQVTDKIISMSPVIGNIWR